MSKELDGDLIKQLSGYMRIGAEYILATAACGIDEITAAEWKTAADKAGQTRKPGVFLDLYEAIRSSTAYAEVIALQRLSAEGGASGAKWLLEKMNPEKYG